MDLQNHLRTWVRIDLDALENNFKILKSRVNKNTKIMSVVKADAYGHGVRQCASVLDKAGTDWFAVSSLDEAKELRNFGIKKPILILGYTPVMSADALAEYDLTQAVFDYEYAEQLAIEAKKAGVIVNGHIKIDTGMSRLGFDGFSNDTPNQVALTAKFDSLNITGIFTHFTSADFDGDENGEITKQAYNAFVNIIDKTEKLGVKYEIRHCCNSAASVNMPEMQLDMVREGILLYGLWPSNETAQHQKDLNINPVMEFKTSVSMIKNLPAGRTLSYGRTYKLENDRKIATVCVGYADGYLRSFSSKANMLVHGQRVPVLGRVCMDQLMLDVTDVQNVETGDTVVIFGREDKEFISVDELAKIAGTINYELVCMISRRVPRVYIKNNKVVSVTDYLNGDVDCEK